MEKQDGLWKNDEEEELRNSRKKKRLQVSGRVFKSFMPTLIPLHDITIRLLYHKDRNGHITT